MRRLWVRGLLAVAAVLSVLSIVAVWANRQLLNPSNWADTSSALLQKQTVREAVGRFLVDELYAHVDVEAQLRRGLPKELSSLAGPASGALRSAAEQAAQAALGQPRVQDAWRQANRLADEELLRIVRGQSALRLQGETVVLDLRTILTDLGRRLGVSPSLVEGLPDSVAEVRVVRGSSLGVIRSVVRGLRPLAILLVALAVCCYGLALAAAGGERRRAVMSAGVSLVLAGLAVLLARKIAQPQLISSVTKDASIEPAANDAYSVATSLLVQVAGSAIILGLLPVAAGWLAGPSHWAVAGRRFAAPRLLRRPALAYELTVVLLALVFAWGPIPSTRNPVQMALYAFAALLGAHLLRRHVSAEFPDAELVPVRTAVSNYGHALGERLGHLPAALAHERGGGHSLASELERLADLHERRALSDEEYAAAKRATLGQPV